MVAEEGGDGDDGDGDYGEEDNGDDEWEKEEVMEKKRNKMKKKGDENADGGG